MDVNKKRYLLQNSLEIDTHGRRRRSMIRQGKKLDHIQFQPMEIPGARIILQSCIKAQYRLGQETEPEYFHINQQLVSDHLLRRCNLIRGRCFHLRQFPKSTVITAPTTDRTPFSGCFSSSIIFASRLVFTRSYFSTQFLSVGVPHDFLLVPHLPKCSLKAISCTPMFSFNNYRLH